MPNNSNKSNSESGNNNENKETNDNTDNTPIDNSVDFEKIVEPFLIFSKCGGAEYLRDELTYDTIDSNAKIDIAYNHLLGDKLTKDEIFKICVDFEHHPDNVSPCLHGGLTINMMINENIPIYKKVNISNDIYFTVIIPDYEVKTEDARKVLKTEVNIKDSIFNTSHSLMLIKALELGDFDLLKYACDDKLHVPYRKNLIDGYDDIKKQCIDAGAAAFTISGSGSTMIIMSKYNNFSNRIKLGNNYKIYDLNIDNDGVKCL
jgi:homoserine kinase